MGRDGVVLGSIRYWGYQAGLERTFNIVFKASFPHLTIELQLEILQYLSPKDLSQLCCTSRDLYVSARRLLYKTTTGNFKALRRLGIQHVRSMCQETLSMVTTLSFQHNLDVTAAKEMLQKCAGVKHLDVGEFLKHHEIARPGSSDLSPSEERNPSEVLEYLTTSCRDELRRIASVRITPAPGRVLGYLFGFLTSVERLQISQHYLPRYAVPGKLFEACSSMTGLKALTLDLPPPPSADLQLLSSRENFPNLRCVSWPLEFFPEGDWQDFKDAVTLCSTSHWRFHNTSSRGFVIHAESLHNYDGIPEGLAHYVPTLDSFCEDSPTTVDVNWATGFSGPTQPGRRVADIVRARELLVDGLDGYTHKRMLYQCEEPPSLAAENSVGAFNGIAEVLTAFELRLFDKKLMEDEGGEERAMRELRAQWAAWLADFLPRCTNMTAFRTWNNGAAVFPGFRPVHLEIMRLSPALAELCQEHALRRLDLDLGSLPHNVRAKPNSASSPFDPAGYEYEAANTEYVRSCISSSIAQLLFLTAENMSSLEHLALRELRIRTRMDKQWLLELPSKLPNLRSLKVEGKYYYSDEDENSLVTQADGELSEGVLAGLRSAQLASRVAGSGEKCEVDLDGLAFVKTAIIRA